jgi:hypothetical protein
MLATAALLAAAASCAPFRTEAADPPDGADPMAVHAHHGHAGHSMGAAGAPMATYPAFGDPVFQAHPAGGWMVSYGLMRTRMKGVRSGTTDIPFEKFDFGRYMMMPTAMTMDMHMLMAMVGLGDGFTLMGTATYQVSRMDMVMGFESHPPVTTSGVGDTELRAIVKFGERLTGSFGVSLPTGRIDRTIRMMEAGFRAPYDMQPGSGTVDLRPALTWAVDGSRWSGGAQLVLTHRIGRNSSHYNLGDGARATAWLQRASGPVAAWARLAGGVTGRIRGEDPELARIAVLSPDNDARNYGGRRLDGLIGVGCTRGPFSFGLEGGAPLHQSLNGVQLKTRWMLSGGLQLMF